MPPCLNITMEHHIQLLRRFVLSLSRSTWKPGKENGRRSDAMLEIPVYLDQFTHSDLVLRELSARSETDRHLENNLSRGGELQLHRE